jgi:hypothetical protein
MCSFLVKSTFGSGQVGFGNNLTPFSYKTESVVKKDTLEY